MHHAPMLSRQSDECALDDVMRRGRDGDQNV
jgi:hypothetical protein